MGYIAKKKKNIYYRKSDHTWYYDKTIKGNRFCSFGYKSQKECEESFIRNFNSFMLQKKLTFLKLVVIYKENLKERLKRNTIYLKSLVIDKYVVPFFKNYSLNKISSSDFELWKKSLIKNNLNLSVKHINRIIGVCKDLFHYLHVKYNIDSGYNILSYLKDDSIPKKDAIWSLEDFNQFISVIDEYKYLVCFHLMFFYGLRFGEALGLKFANVNFDEQIISIVSQVVYDHDLHKQVDTTPKTKDSIRSFFVDDFTLKLIKNLYEEDKVYVFGHGNLIPARTTFRTHFNHYIKKSGVKKIKIHALRKSCSTRLYHTIKDIKSVGILLGHSKESMTMHYIQAQREHQLKLIQKMQNQMPMDNKIYINLHYENNKKP